MVRISRKTTRTNRVGIILLLLCSAFLLNTNLVAQQSSSRLIANKISMAINMSKSFEANKPALNEQQKQRLAENNQQLQKAIQLSKQNQWQEAEQVVGVVIKEFIALQPQGKKELSIPCMEKSSKLQTTASLLIDIFENTSEIASSEKAILNDLRNQLQRLENKDIDQTANCKQLANTVKSGIILLENRYQNKTAIVKLDLSTDKKLYEYEVRSFRTYEMLLAKQLEVTSIKDEHRNTIKSLTEEAGSLSQRADKYSQQKQFLLAEEWQIKANDKMIEALKLAGLYLAE